MARESTLDYLQGRLERLAAALTSETGGPDRRRAMRAELDLLGSQLDRQRKLLAAWQLSLADRGVPCLQYGSDFQPAGRVLGEG